MTQPQSDQPDSDAQVSQGPSSSDNEAGFGGADAVPDTPDTNFHQDATDNGPDRRGSALDATGRPGEQGTDT